MSLAIPMVSILIPNFNKAAFLPETLDSIHHQSFKDWECIIVDDHSTDESVSIINKFIAKDDRFQLHVRPSTLLKGGNACRNYALTKARGEFVVFFDSDDWLLSDALEKRKTLITQGNYDFVASQGLFWNGKDNEALLISDATIRKTIDCFFDFQPLWLTQGVIIRKQFLEAKKITWNESVPFLQDVLYNINLLLHSNSYLFSQEIDWIWRKSDSHTLGNRASKVNTYSDNKALADEVFVLSNKYHHGNNDWVKQFCLQRFYELINNNAAKNINSALMAYPDTMTRNLKVALLHALSIKCIAKIGIWSYKYKVSLGKSLFFRIWKKKWMKETVKAKATHFLSKSIMVKDRIPTN